jgi:hypothetical protein
MNVTITKYEEVFIGYENSKKITLNHLKGLLGGTGIEEYQGSRWVVDLGYDSRRDDNYYVRVATRHDEYILSVIYIVQRAVENNE